MSTSVTLLVLKKKKNPCREHLPGVKDYQFHNRRHLAHYWETGDTFSQHQSYRLYQQRVLLLRLSLRVNFLDHVMAGCFSLSWGRLLQERKEGSRRWSGPRSQASPWDGCQVWVLGFAQESIQEQVMVE